MNFETRIDYFLSNTIRYIRNWNVTSHFKAFLGASLVPSCLGG